MSRPAWRQPVKIADAVVATLQRLGLEGRIRQHDIWRVWPLVVGPQIAHHAQPHSIWHGRLIIHVTDSVWLHHLSMMRHRLVAALNEQLKPAEIREMVLRVGEVPLAPTGPSLASAGSELTRGIDPTLMAEIDKALAPLGDAPFREALRRLWLRASKAPASTTEAPRK
jgi:predicted nucleic acid-binding Zn ribbon protein